MARGSLARVGALGKQNEHSAWVLAHRALSRLAAERARTDVEEARCLLAAWRARAHVHAGFGSFVEYVGQLFGYGARLTHEKLRVAEALEGLPLLTAALESGALDWSVVRELTRVVTGGTEGEWLAAARGSSARQVEALVSGAAPGSAPGDARDPAARRQVLRFEVAADTFALVREAIAHLSQLSGSRLDDDGPAQQPRGSAISGALAGGLLQRGHLDAPEPEGSAHVGTRLIRSIPRAVRRRVLHRDHRCCSVPGCRNTRFVDLHHLVPRCEGGQHTAQVLITLCGVHHRAVHRGELIIEGTSVDRVRFLHADGTPYGGGLNAAAVDAHAKAFSALRNLGFREKEVRGVLGALREDPSMRQLEVGQLLRQALERLGPAARVQ